MAIGDILPTVSFQGITESISGLGSYILIYFRTNAAPLEYMPNKAWNDPIDGDANGMFRIYYQNVHGVP
jgi:hypothetical protein